MDEEFVEEEFDEVDINDEEIDDINSDSENEFDDDDDDENELNDNDVDIDEPECEEINLISDLNNEFEDVIKTKYLINTQKKKSRNIMTPYERCRVLGLREKQLIDGSLPLVETNDCYNERDISLKELKSGKMPFIIIRTLPNGIKEYWKCSELILIR
jgi:DNA-directed RNA polymerase subunit K/omega